MPSLEKVGQNLKFQNGLLNEHLGKIFYSENFCRGNFYLTETVLKKIVCNDQMWCASLEKILPAHSSEVSLGLINFVCNSARRKMRRGSACEQKLKLQIRAAILRTQSVELF